MHLFPPPKSLARAPGALPSPQDAPRVEFSGTAPKNGYTLSISSKGIAIAAANPAAAFHAQTTLDQIASQFPSALPCLQIEDWPDLAVRGYMLDISRCKVPTQASLFALVDLLASLKYNQLQLYTEHTFAYREHPTVWQGASPLGPADLRALDRYCQDRFIELVPNQNSFGHMERWLRHPAYHALAESPRGFEHPISGWRPFGSTLRPTRESADFADSLFAELLPNFSSRQLNIGGDEPWELGQGHSREEVARRGKTRVYLDHLLRIQKKARGRGCHMQFWGDIIINQPELARELGPDVTALLWGYELGHPFARQCQAMREAGTRFTVVPGTSTWNSIGGRLYTALPNIDAAATNAKEYGAQGILLTDWGDNGHPQSHLLSILPILQASGRAWNASTEPLELKGAATRLIPEPLTDSEYTAIEELSASAACFSTYLHNESWLNKILFAKSSEIAAQLKLEELRGAQERLSHLSADGELELARRLLLHATEKGRALVEKRPLPRLPPALLESYRAHWLARNRPGGLEESIGHFG